MLDLWDLKFVSVFCWQPHFLVCATYYFHIILCVLHFRFYIFWASYIWAKYFPRRQTSPVNRPIIWAHPRLPPLTILILGGFSSQSLVITSNNRISNFKRTRSLKWMFLSKVWNIPNIYKRLKFTTFQGQFFLISTRMLVNLHLVLTCLTSHCLVHIILTIIDFCGLCFNLSQ